MIRYEFVDRKYYKNGKHITKKQALQELKPYQLNKLLKVGKCGVREPKNESITMSKKDIKLVEKVRALYKTDSNSYPKLGLKYELWKRNPKGYWNFISYLDNLDQLTIDYAILMDLNNQKKRIKRVSCL